MSTTPVGSSPVDGASGAQDTSSVIARWQRMRTSRIERRALALANLASANEHLAESEFALSAARDLKADVREVDAPETTKTMTSARKVWTAIIGVPVNGIAILGAIIALGLGTEFWTGHLPASARSVHIFAVPFPLDLATVIPVGFEGTIWALTMMATVMVCFQLRTAAYTRPMWAVATVVALSNGVHNASYDLIGGLGLGALSLSSPYLVHKYVLFVRSMTNGKTITEALAETVSRWRFAGKTIVSLLRSTSTVLIAVLDFVLHPVLTTLAVLLWRMHRGISYSYAHGIVVGHLRNKRSGRVNEIQADGTSSRKVQTYTLSLIDLIDPTEAPRAGKSPARKRAVSTPKTSPEPDAPVTDLVVEKAPVSIERHDTKPEWFASDMSPTEVMVALLDDEGDMPGAVLDRRTVTLLGGGAFKAGLGRKTRSRWLSQQRDSVALAAGQE